MQWLAQLFSRRRRYDDLAISIQEHIAERAEELMESGMPRAEAEQTARREFGNVSLIEQRSREEWQWQTVESIAGRCAICTASTDQVAGLYGDRGSHAGAGHRRERRRCSVW